MRILLTSYPLPGHVNPILPLAHAAARAGHDVVIATGADLIAHVEGHGLAAWEVGPTHAEAAESAPPSALLFPHSAEKRAIDLAPRTLAWAPGLVVSEEFELAGAVAAALCGARYVVHGLGVQPPPPVWSTLSAAICRLHEQWRTGVGVEQVRRAAYLQLWPSSLHTGEKVWLSPRPLRPAAGGPLPGERLPGGIDMLPYPQTVHLTLGTLFHHNTAVLDAALAGLLKLRVNVVVTTGPGSDPGRLGPLPPHVVAKPYLPHALLLPRCHLVISQGGAGTVLGALAAGLPQLMLPQGADQFLNAAAATAAGAALSLAPGQVTPASVAAAAARLLREPSFRKASTVLAAEIAARPDADEVLASLTSAATAPGTLTRPPTAHAIPTSGKEN